MADFLPLDAQEEIGQLMSYGAIEAALSREIPSRDLKSEIESLTMDDPNFRMAQLEERLEYERRTIGLKNGSELLAYLIKTINQPIKAWFDVDRLNQGGRPPKTVERDYLLLRLAAAAPAVIGRRPTATANGPFVRLCAAVVVACGLDDRGIERAVEKAIKELSKERRKGFKGFQTACNSNRKRFSQLMIARLVDLLPISFDKFAAVSGTLLNRDSAIVRTWQSATRPQPTSAQDRLSPLVSARLPWPEARSRRPRWRRICPPTAIRSP